MSTPQGSSRLDRGQGPQASEGAAATDAPVRPPRRELQRLGAKFREEHHSGYFRELKRVIDTEPAVRNIAVTGAYGTGKSSVLGEVTRNYPERVLELSLSTVASERDESGAGPHGDPASTTTNRIQKEIVKQILYRDAPSRMRGSRFRRISRFRWGHEIGFAVGGVALVLLLLFLSGQSERLVAVAQGHTGFIVAAYGILLAASSALVVGVRWMTHNRVFLEKLSAGPAAVSLAPHSMSYFDQYMDEIVYYFEASGRDIVIFEDIDRFEDTHIFETLRSLNTLLNGAAQVRFRKGHSAVRQMLRSSSAPSVKFIYALRDSVFERLGTDGADATSGDAAADEVRRANRTKFFDLVIPIVPFITYRNARDLLSEEMEGTGVSNALINLVGRHVADKRLIANMRNEYEMFADRLLKTENQMPPGLDPDGLFAMVLYKSFHMADFDDIRLGQSQLDKLHASWQKLVEHCVDESTTQSHDRTRRIKALGSEAAKSAELGKRLQTLATLLVPNGRNLQVTVGEETYSFVDFTKPDLWYAISTEEKPVKLTSRQSGPQRNLAIKDLQKVLGDAFNVEQWQREDRARLIRERAAIREELTFLRGHSWQAVHARPEFTAPTSPEQSPESFRQITKRLLGSELARELVAAGYINQYFALNISIYYGRHLSRAAQDFAMRALDQGEPLMLYPLQSEDVPAILKDKSDAILRDRSAYNVWILDHLLATDDARAHTLIEHIPAWGTDDQTFTARYLANGTHTEKFAAALAPLLGEILTHLVSEAEVEEPQRITLVSAALGHLDAEAEYAWNDEVAQFVGAHYTEFEVLTGAVPEEQAARAMAMIAAMGLQLPLVAQLNLPARQAAIANGTYRISEANLTALTGSPSIALNELRTSNSQVYETALSRLSEYLDAIREAAPPQYTVTSNDEFLDILREGEKAASDDDDAIVELVHLAAGQCCVSTLTDAPTRTWPALTSGRRTAPTATNLIAYLGVFHSLDENAAALLRDIEAITQPEALEATDRIQLAVAILNASAHLASPGQRTHLAASLGHEDYLDPSEITPERGRFASLLIEQKLIADSTETFASGLIVDWKTREFAIEKSQKFSDYIRPDVLPARDVGAFFGSARVEPMLKDTVLADIGAYITSASADAGNAAGRYALQSQTVLGYNQLEALCASGAEQELLIKLIAAAETLSNDELRSLLRSMGKPYTKIADHGWSRPRVPNDVAHRTILHQLLAAGIVSKFPEENDQLRVSLRRS